MVFVETSFPRGGIAKPKQDESGGTGTASKKNEKMVISTNINNFFFVFIFSTLFYSFADIRRNYVAKK